MTGIIPEEDINQEPDGEIWFISGVKFHFLTPLILSTKEMADL